MKDMLARGEVKRNSINLVLVQNSSQHEPSKRTTRRGNMNADLLDSNVSLVEDLRSSRTPRIKHQKFVFKNDVVEKSEVTSLDSTVMM